MKRKPAIAVCISLLLGAGAILIAQPQAPNAQLIAARNATEKELESIAIIERKVMVPMRDGKRMATDIYRPKDTSKKYPDHLRPHAVQLQLLGRAQRRAARHERRTRRP